MQVSLELSPVLQSQVVKFARVSGSTVEEFMILAVAEEIAAMEHHEWLIGNRPDGEIDPCGRD